MKLKFYNTRWSFGQFRHERLITTIYSRTERRRIYGDVFEELNEEQCLHNGIRLILHKICDNFLDLQITTEVNVDWRVLLARFHLTPSDSTFPFSSKTIQFTIQVAFCITIDKTQASPHLQYCNHFTIAWNSFQSLPAVTLIVC